MTTIWSLWSQYGPYFLHNSCTLITQLRHSRGGMHQVESYADTKESSNGQTRSQGTDKMSAHLCVNCSAFTFARVQSHAITSLFVLIENSGVTLRLPLYEHRSTSQAPGFHLDCWLVNRMAINEEIKYDSQDSPKKNNHAIYVCCARQHECILVAWIYQTSFLENLFFA